MIELPEAITLAGQLNSSIAGKTVCRVLPATKPHKFCWFSANPSAYEGMIAGAKIISAEYFGIFVEIQFDNGMKLCINDGVNIRLISDTSSVKSYQLLIVFDDGTALSFSVAMYGGIVLHDGTYDNEYYLKSKSYISPFSPDFGNQFIRLAHENPKLSAKAFLATQQRFPGIGNGVLQDILFQAKINPRRKMSTIDSFEKEKLLNSVISVINDMTAKGGRDTEKDIFGNNGGYITKMSKKSIEHGCSVCASEIIKETYLGGSVYYCPVCQKL